MVYKIHTLDILSLTSQQLTMKKYTKISYFHKKSVKKCATNKTIENDSWDGIERDFTIEDWYIWTLFHLEFGYKQFGYKGKIIFEQSMFLVTLFAIWRGGNYN